MPELAREIDAIPVVATTAERAGKYPTPSVNQRVHNLETGAIDRWNGSAWTSTPLTLPASLAGMTFTAPVLIANGSTSAPAIALAADTNTGWYSAGVGLLSLVINGTVVASFQAATSSFLNNIAADSLTVENITQLDGQFILANETVDFGAADSAGTGYRVLRVPNA
jgi:hypothetical protein